MTNEELLNIYWIVINLLAFATFIGFICSKSDDAEVIVRQLEENNYDDDYIDTFLL